MPAGGVYEPINTDLYSYVGNNPILYIDPDGNLRFGKRPLDNNRMFTAFLTGLVIALITTHPSQIEKSFELMDKGNFEPVHEHGFYDDILMKKAEENVTKSGKFDPEDYSLLGIGKPKNNCQDFADALRKEYTNLYNTLDEKGKKEVDARVEALKQKIHQEEKGK